MLTHLIRCQSDLQFWNLNEFTMVVPWLQLNDLFNLFLVALFPK